MSASAICTLPSTGKRVRDTSLTLLGLGLLVLALYFIDGGASTQFRQALALFAIWAVAATSLNLINGTTGILSLGHHGFMLVGGYTTALLTLPELRRQQIADSAWGSYQHQFGGSAARAEQTADDVDFSSRLMRLATGGR